jgi:hypothetical protein
MELTEVFRYSMYTFAVHNKSIVTDMLLHGIITFKYAGKEHAGHIARINTVSRMFHF